MTPKKSKPEIEKDSDRNINTGISGEMRKAYLDYAMSVIVSRAIPSIEDGLKPVQRRILYAMHQMGLKPGSQTKKSARVVGDVLGKYHPHGDTAVYDALVRLTQPFSLRYPLVFGQGNFGCFTKDTKVALADGRNLNFEKLIEEHKKGKRNFTFTVDKGKVKVAEIKNPRRTKKNQKIMKVTLDNGEGIKCTLNHKFMLKTGKYKEAKNLSEGDSLMPFYSKISTKEDKSNPKLVGYNMVFQPITNLWDFVHVLFDEWNLNNNIHKKLFNEKIVASNKRRKTNMNGKKKFVKICKYISEKNMVLNKENYEKIRKEVFGIKSFTSLDLEVRKYFQGNKNLVLHEINSNHKVSKTEILNKCEDVYDLTIDKTHNFALASGIFVHNSVDGDSAAAMRYTEARLKKISSELLQDIDKETVNFLPNFDDSLKEPELLPGKLPALILNGAAGIAVGMSTNIPPHNLIEVCDAIISYIKKPEISIEELNEIVKAPDFPTGGSVTGDMGELYKTGKGRLTLRGKASVEKIKKKPAIVITEIPYLLNKTTLIEQIANLVQNKKVKNISDLRDESSKGKIRIVIELKNNTNPKFVLNALYKYTRLQDFFNVNMLALVKGQPKVLTLKDVVKEYVEYRKKIITKRINYQLKKAEKRLEIVEGLIIALKNIDSIIKTIKSAKNTTHALESLMRKFKLSKNQAQAVLETKLHQLTSLEQDKLKKEDKELKEKIKEYKKILSNIKEVLKIIVKEVNEMKKDYGDERRTSVLGKIKKISEKDIVQKKDVVVTITEKGYCKRMDLQSYKEQKRGGKGVIGSNLATGDFVRQLITCSTHDYLLFFTTRGRVLWLKAYDIPEVRRYGKGKAIVNLLNLKNEKPTSVISVRKFENYLFMATKKGKVKKISLEKFSRPRTSGIKAIKLPATGKEGDELIDVKVIKKGDEVFLATRKGQAIRFNSDDVRDMGRASYGVTGIKLGKDDKVVGLEVLKNKAILSVTEKGYGKRTAVNDYRKTARAGKGVINLKVSGKTGNVVTTSCVKDSDSIIITTSKGMVIRTSLKNIRIMGRATRGVKIVRLQQGDKVTDLVKVPEAEEVDEKQV